MASKLDRVMKMIPVDQPAAIRHRNYRFQHVSFSKLNVSIEFIVFELIFGFFLYENLQRG